jgi:hypothetical protein
MALVRWGGKVEPPHKLILTYSCAYYWHML